MAFAAKQGVGKDFKSQYAENGNYLIFKKAANIA